MKLRLILLSIFLITAMFGEEAFLVLNSIDETISVYNSSFEPCDTVLDIGGHGTELYSIKYFDYDRSTYDRYYNFYTFCLCNRSLKYFWCDLESDEYNIEDFFTFDSLSKPYDVFKHHSSVTCYDGDPPRYEYTSSDLFISNTDFDNITGISDMPRPGFSTGDYYTIEHDFNTPQALYHDGTCLFFTTANIDPVDSSYGNGELWRYYPDESEYVSAEIGKNPTDIYDYNNHLHVLCAGDGSSYFGTVYIVCKSCMTIEDSVFLGGNPQKLHFSLGYIISCSSETAVPGSGKLLAYDVDSHEILYDMTSTGNELRGTGFNDFFCDFYDNIYIPSMDSAWVEHITFRPHESIIMDFVETIPAGAGACDIVYHFDREAIEETYTPEKIEMFTAYPNPFNGSCTIETPGSSHIQIYDLRGNLVDNIQNHGGAVLWQPSGNIESGVYLIRAISEKSCQTKRIMYLK